MPLCVTDGITDSWWGGLNTLSLSSLEVSVIYSFLSRFHLHPYGALLNPVRSQYNDNCQPKAPGPHRSYADSSTAVCKHRHKLLLRFGRGRDIRHDPPCIYWRSSRRSGDRWCHTWDRPHHRQRLTVLGTPPPHLLRAAAKGSTVRQSSGFRSEVKGQLSDLDYSCLRWGTSPLYRLGRYLWHRVWRHCWCFPYPTGVGNGVGEAVRYGFIMTRWWHDQYFVV